MLDSFDFVSYDNNLSEVPAKELRALQRQAYLRFHLRPPVMRSMLRNLNSLDKILFIAKQARHKVFE